MRRILSVMILITASGCANRAAMPGDPNFASGVKQESVEGEGGDEPLPPDDPITRAAASKLKVMQTGGLDCGPSEALGVVDVHERMPTEAQALDILKRRAVVLGAEGITGVEFHHGEGGSEVTHLSGMAVRCRDVLHGRQYKVIKELDIAGAMGKEDDAFDELKKMAWATGANILLNVKFEHGEGADGKTHVSGTAARAF
jgi:uncharacterized protein YbjQ (UPF0145 family)